MDGGQARAAQGNAGAAGLDVAALDKRLNLRRRAREEGARNHPPSDAEDLSETERQIVALVAGERARLDAQRSEARTEAEQKLRALAPAPQDFAGPALEARLALKQAAGRLGHDWTEAATRSRQARDHLERFKRTHNLHRQAHYPRSTLMQAGLLLCAALFEAMFSAALFAEDDARGLLGGAITAIGLSGANVTLGFLGGFLGLRWLQHARWPLKTLGAVAFMLFTALALMLNLFAADWRDRLAIAHNATPDRGADASFHIWSLLQLQSPQAIILLMLGAGVWVFATLKGFSGFDDPYPDYGRMDRAAHEASDALSTFRSSARLDLEEPVDAAKAALTARFEQMREQFETLNKAFDGSARRMEALDAAARSLDEAAAGAVQLYRQENTAARSTPAPAYFGTPPPASGAALDALTGSAAIVDGARTQLRDAQRAMAEALEGLVEELEATQAHLDRAQPE